MLARSRRIGDPESQGGSVTYLLDRKWFVWHSIPCPLGCRCTSPLGESSSPRGPVWSAINMCAEAAMPPRELRVCIADAAAGASRQSRSTMCIGSAEVEIGLARIAFRQTPTDEELNPILPTIPAYTQARQSGAQFR